MFPDNSIVLFLTLFSITVEVQSLVELPTEGKNDIAYTEAIIRDTYNNIFTALRIGNVRNKPRLKEFTILHNFFVSITLKDFNNLKEIERLTRVYDINNGRNFITEINDILNEQNESDILTNDNNVTVYTAITFINKLRNLKEIYKLQYSMSSSEINPEILNHLHNDEDMLANDTTDTSVIDYSNETILSDNPFWVPKIDRRVYKGHSTRISTFPFMASIHVFNRFRCAGSIIKNNFILTTSTCLQLVHKGAFFRKSPAYFSVRVGSTYTDSGGEKIGVDSIHFYPSFNPRTLAHNIGLIKLSRRIMFAMLGSTAKRIEFDRRPKPLSSYIDEVVVLGWGAKRHYDDEIHGLSYSRLDIYSRRKCQKYYTKKYVTARHFCVASFPKKGGACQHDIGGPGIVGGKLMGVINFAGKYCGESPTVFTKVGYYATWIGRVLGPEGENVFNHPFLSLTTKRIYYKIGTNTTRENNVTNDTDTNDFVYLFRGFQNFVSNIFSRAHDYNTTSEEIAYRGNGANETNAPNINILD